MELPNRAVLVFVLLANMLDTFFQGITSLRPKDSTGEADIFAYISFLVLIFGIFCAANIAYICHKHRKVKRTLIFELVLMIAELLVAVLYFYGNNITFIVTNFEEELGCDLKCAEDNQIAASIALGLTLLYYQVIPPYFQRADTNSQSKPSEENLRTTWHTAVDMIILTPQIDALYTVVVDMLMTNDFCSRIDLSISISFLVLVVVAMIAVMATQSVSSYRSLPKSNQWRCIIPLSFLLLLLSFILYILADNNQPLDCAFGCDFVAANQTLNDFGCSMVANSALRLGFTIVTITLISTFSILFMCCILNSTGGESEGAV